MHLWGVVEKEVVMAQIKGASNTISTFKYMGSCNKLYKLQMWKSEGTATL